MFIVHAWSVLLGLPFYSAARGSFSCSVGTIHWSKACSKLACKAKHTTLYRQNTVDKGTCVLGSCSYYSGVKQCTRLAKLYLKINLIYGNSIWKA